ncbi:hypothetical protein, partial [Bacteroides sp. AF37-16AC]|uniref:hypothetical protein n=1 Tax=Bacteroides sp. AF37-16AC TaxID=2292934 RepID=UPI001A9DDC03
VGYYCNAVTATVRYISILYPVYQIFNNSAVSSKIKPQTFGKVWKKKNRRNYQGYISIFF